VDAVADASGAIHVVWQVNGSGVNQIHYQRYSGSGGGPTLLDTTVVSRGETVQSPVLRVDSEQGLHLAFVSVSGGLSQVRYKHRSPERGWDYSSTEVTALAAGSTSRPTLVTGLDHEVSALYFLGTGGGIRPMERRRYSPVNILAAPAVPASPVHLALSARPNPLRAGSALSFRLADPGLLRWIGGMDVLEIYDLAGRRVASAPLVDDVGGPRAEIPGSVTRGWGSGVYFARVRDRETIPARLVVLR
jgi:hypothetical protein